MNKIVRHQGKASDRSDAVPYRLSLDRHFSGAFQRRSGVGLCLERTKSPHPVRFEHASVLASIESGTLGNLPEDSVRLVRPGTLFVKAEGGVFVAHRLACVRDGFPFACKVVEE